MRQACERPVEVGLTGQPASTSYRWGILATGNVAASMAEAINAAPNAELLAVGSRTQAKADAFADRFGVPRRYSSYESLVVDPDVDVVYVASPHSSHHPNVMLALAAGKHVLCEKPLTLNAAEAAQCVAMARHKRLFLMEAVWMRFFPAAGRLKEWVADGIIGDISLVEASFCLDVPFDPEHRLYNPALGGGALLDLGIYPLSLATMLLGYPADVRSDVRLGLTGVDEANTITLLYEGGARARLESSVRESKPREALISGTDGSIKVHDAFFCPTQLTLEVAGREPQTVTLPASGNGYLHEVEEVHECLRAGLTESPRMTLDETVRVMRLMDGLRAEWGISYPGEQHL